MTRTTLNNETDQNVPKHLAKPLNNISDIYLVTIGMMNDLNFSYRNEQIT